MKRLMTSVLCGVFAVGVALSTTGVPAGAATATVGNGLTTTDLNPVGMTPSTLASAPLRPGVPVSHVPSPVAPPPPGRLHAASPRGQAPAPALHPTRSVSGFFPGPPDPDYAVEREYYGRTVYRGAKVGI